MTTYLVTGTLPPADLKMQLQAPYVSKAFNQRFLGILPTGIYRGFTPSVATLTLNIVSSSAGDHVAVCETLDATGLVASNFNVTVRHEGDTSLDLSLIPDATYAVVLEARYDLISGTPLTGVSTAVLAVIPTADVLPQHVVLCNVTKAMGGLTVDLVPREATGGTLLTPSTGASPSLVGTYVFTVNTSLPGPFGSFTPPALLGGSGFGAGQLVCLNFTGGAYAPGGDDVFVLGFTVDGVPTGNIGGGSGDMIGRSHFGLGGNPCFSVWTTVSAGAHAFELKGSCVYGTYLQSFSRFTITRF